MPDQKTEKYIALALLLSLSVLFFVLSFLSQGFTGGADNINHYFIARYSWQYSELIFDGWGRPLYTILSSPFAQFGFMGIKVFNILIALLTIWITYLTGKKLGYSSSLLAFVIIAFSPIYLLMIFTALTEILAGLIIVLAVYLFVREKFIWSAIVLSLIYFARAETIIFYPIFLVAFLFKKQYKAIPFLFLGIAVFTIIGGFFFRDFLWLIHKFPYPIHSVTYKNSGPLLHFFNLRDKIFGLPQEILLVIGIVVLAFRLFSKNERTRAQSFYEFLIIFIPFAGFFSMHSILYWKALGGSVGYYRVITSVIPLSCLICMKGFSFIEEKLKPIKWMSYLAMSAISIWIILVAFRTFHYPVLPDNDEQVIINVSHWLKNSEYAKRKIFYEDVRFPFFLDINPYNHDRAFEIYDTTSLGFVEDGSILIWDSHFGPNEHGIPRNSIFLNKRFRLLRVFEPDKEIVTLGGVKYEVLIFQKMPAGIESDNLEIMKSLKDKEDAAYILVSSYINDFETPGPDVDKARLITKQAHSGKRSYLMDETAEFSPGFIRQIKDLMPGLPKIKVRVSVEIYPLTAISDDQTCLIVSLDNSEKSYDYSAKPLHSMNLVLKSWNHLEEEVKLTPVHSATDQVKVYIYNSGKNKFYMDDLKVEIFKMSQNP